MCSEFTATSLCTTLILCETFICGLSTSFRDSWLHSGLLCKVLETTMMLYVFLSKVSPFMNKITGFCRWSSSFDGMKSVLDFFAVA